MSHPRSSVGAGLVVALLAAFGSPETRAACTLRTQWQWVGSVRDRGFPLPTSTPVIVQLTDDNGDGVIGVGDTPDVAFVHLPGRFIGLEAHLTALNGRDGSDLFTTGYAVVRPQSLAAGDLDGDGVVELVALDPDAGFPMVYRHDGSLAWESRRFPAIRSQATVGLADLDQDGSPEIYYEATVRAANGTARWQGTAGRGRGHRSFLSMNVAADLLPGSPGLELVAGNTCYASDGVILWSRADLPDGFASVSDLDGDGVAEIVLVTAAPAFGFTDVHVLDRAGLSIAPS